MRPSPTHAATVILTVATLLSGVASAQDAVRGAALYRELPGQPAAGSCISCHGEPVNNRNSVLRGAAGPDLISKTIAAVAGMGFLRQYLTDADLVDIAAYLSTIVPAGPVDALPELWPTAHEFGTHLVGTQSRARTVSIRNLQPRGDMAIATVHSSDPIAFPVQHDCPLSLPPLAQCSATTWFRPQDVGPAVASFTVVDTSGRVLRAGLLNGTGAAAAPPTLSWAANTPVLADFGQVALGQSSRRELTLINTSAAVVTLVSVRVTGSNASRFTLDAPCAVTGRLESMASCVVTLGFTPSSAGRAEGWIELISDASNAPLVRIAATGVAPTTAEPIASAPVGGGGGAMSAHWVAMLLAAVIALRMQRND